MPNETEVAQGNTDATAETTKTTEQTTSETAKEAATETAKESAGDQSKEETKKSAVVDVDPAKFVFPEGAQLDEAMIKEFLPLAKELGVTQESAQKLVDLYGKGINSVGEQIVAMQAKIRDESYLSVMEEIKKGTPVEEKFEQNIGRINTVMDKYGGEGFSEIVHQAAAQLAGADKAVAKQFYAALDKLSRAAGIDDKLIGGESHVVTGSNPYPGLPGKI